MLSALYTFIIQLIQANFSSMFLVLLTVKKGHTERKASFGTFNSSVDKQVIVVMCSSLLLKLSWLIMPSLSGQSISNYMDTWMSSSQQTGGKKNLLIAVILHYSSAILKYVRHSRELVSNVRSKNKEKKDQQLWSADQQTNFSSCRVSRETFMLLTYRNSRSCKVNFFLFPVNKDLTVCICLMLLQRLNHC